MHEIILQLHGGSSGGGSSEIKSSAPGSSAVATIDNASEGTRQKVRQQIAKARGRNYTNKTGGTGSTSTTYTDTIKKTMLGE